MKDRRSNCAAFHESIKQGIEMVKTHDVWINGNGTPGAKTQIANTALQVKILIALNSAIFLSVVALFFKR
jgi:hypothetical protein